MENKNRELILTIDDNGDSSHTSSPIATNASNSAMRSSSKVISIRDLPEKAVESDFIDSCIQYGAIAYVRLVDDRSALIEYEDYRSAEACVNSTTTNNATFASIQEIPRQGLESSTPSNVLVVYICDAYYPIVTETITSIFKPNNYVRHMIISCRHDVIALIEFEDIQTARTVKHRLNGYFVYAECCYLKLEYSRLIQLNVTRNDVYQWNFAIGALDDRRSNRNVLGYDADGRVVIFDSYAGFGSRFVDINSTPNSMIIDEQVSTVTASIDPRRAALHQVSIVTEKKVNTMTVVNLSTVGVDAPLSKRNSVTAAAADSSAADTIGCENSRRHGIDGNRIRNDHDNCSVDSFSTPKKVRRIDSTPSSTSSDHYRRHRTYSPNHYADSLSISDSDCRRLNVARTDRSYAVVIVHGVDEQKFNTDRVFNIACLYGNIVCIKFHFKALNTCMVQMSDPLSAKHFIDAFNGEYCFGHELKLELAKVPYIKEMRLKPFSLFDGSPSYRVFRNIGTNRYLSPTDAATSRRIVPGSALHLFNLTYDFTAEIFDELLDNIGLARPIETKISKTENSFSGTARFTNTTEAIEALVMLNHTPVHTKSTTKKPFLLKLAFSDCNTNVDDGIKSRSNVQTKNLEFRRCSTPDTVLADEPGLVYDESCIDMSTSSSAVVRHVIEASVVGSDASNFISKQPEKRNKRRRTSADSSDNSSAINRRITSFEEQTASSADHSRHRRSPHRYDRPSRQEDSLISPSSPVEPDGTGIDDANAVVLVHGLHVDYFNTENVFNIACPFGNVVCVKFLLKTSDTCMVQMGDPLAANRFIDAYDGKHCFNRLLKLELSTEPYIKEMRFRPFTLIDGTISYQQFRNCRNNRFLTPTDAAKNRMNRPGPALHLFNLPHDFKPEMLDELLYDVRLVPPIETRVSLSHSESLNSRYATAQFVHTAEAIEALAMLNHKNVYVTEKPFLLRMSFSEELHIDTIRRHRDDIEHRIDETMRTYDDADRLDVSCWSDTALSQHHLIDDYCCTNDDSRSLNNDICHQSSGDIVWHRRDDTNRYDRRRREESK